MAAASVRRRADDQSAGPDQRQLLPVVQRLIHRALAGRKEGQFTDPLGLPQCADQRLAQGRCQPSGPADHIDLSGSWPSTQMARRLLHPLHRSRIPDLQPAEIPDRIPCIQRRTCEFTESEIRFGQEQYRCPHLPDQGLEFLPHSGSHSAIHPDERARSAWGRRFRKVPLDRIPQVEILRKLVLSDRQEFRPAHAHGVRRAGLLQSRHRAASL